MKEQVDEVQEVYRLQGVRVYGSMARGEAGPDSDIDLLVRFGPYCERPVGRERPASTGQA